jgi:hypothetical protein
MAKKPKSFADKVESATQESGRVCPKCGELYQFVQQVQSVKSEETDSWKFNQKMVGVCNCNRSAVMG